MSDQILGAVLKGLLACVGFLELSDEETVDSRAAVTTLESVVHELDQLSDDDRATLAGLIIAEASAEPAGEWRDFLLSAPEALGLVDDEDEDD